MKRYLCPICEKELTARSYCSACKKIIRNPWVFDGSLPNEDHGNYFLNHQSAHPGKACVESNQDRNCESRAEMRQNAHFDRQREALNRRFDQSREEINRTAAARKTAARGDTTKSYTGSSAGRTGSYRQNTAPGSQIWDTSSKNRSGQRIYNETLGRENRGKKGKKGCGCGCLTVILVFWIIGMIGSLLSELDIEYWLDELIYELEDSFEDEFEVDVDSSAAVDEDSDEDWSDDWETVSYDEILAVGDSCSGYIHYEEYGKDVFDELAEAAETELGLTAYEQREEMDNNVLHMGEDESSFYNRYRYWEWEQGTILVCEDSVSGEIHYVGIYGYDREQVIALAGRMAELVEDETEAQLAEAEIRDILEKGDLDEGQYLEIENSEISIYEYDGFYMIDFHAAWE